MADKLDIILGILLDNQQYQTTDKKLDALGKQITELDSIEFNELIGEFERLEKHLEESRERYKRLEEQARQSRETFNQIASSAAQGARISQVVLGAGVATVGGIFAAANAYVQNAERATNVTRAWQAEMDLIRRNGEQIGAVLAKEALPLLTQAARITGKIASFIEQNPGLIKAAIGFGSAAAVVGAVGTAVFRGIEAFGRIGSLIATGQLAAAKIMDKAADKQLLAAAGMGRASGSQLAAGAGGAVRTLAGGAGAAGAGAGVGGAIGFYGAIAGFVALGVAIAALVNQLANHVSKITGLGSQIENAQKKAFEQAEAAGKRTYPGINQFARAAIEADKAAEKAAGSIGRMSKGVSGTTSFGGGISQDVLQAYIQFRETALQIERQFQQDRLRIIQNYNKAVSSAIKDNQSSINRINSNYQKTISNIMRDARKADIEAERDYHRQRAEVVRDAGEEVLRIEEDLQERLREMALEHDQRVDDLVAARDALGLVREQRRFDLERSEAERDANLEIARRRQDLAQKLRDMQVEFQQERIQRQEQLAERLQEAAIQHQEELKQQAEANAERMRQLQEQKNEQLRELDYQHNAELARNREHFIARIRDLDATLLGEQQLRRAYYAVMIRDAQAFFASYRAAMTGGRVATTTSGSITGSTGVIPSRQMGGYTGSGGLIQTHAQEYVMNKETTRAMENLIGGRLSEQALRAFASGGGKGSVVNMSFPGGLVTIPMLADILDDRESKLVRTLTDGLG